MCTCTHFLGLFDVFSIFIYIRSFLFGFLKFFLGIHVELFFSQYEITVTTTGNWTFLAFTMIIFLNSLYH